MALGAFDDKAAPPSEVALAATLGQAYPLWNELRECLASMCAPFSEEWGFTAKSTGWGLRLKRGSRVIVYLAPREGHFLASFVLGERAVRAAQASDLPDPVLTLIDNARRYVEGAAVRVEVRSSGDVGTVRELAAIKIAH